MCCVRGQKKAQKSLSSGVSSLRRVVGHQNDPEEVEVAAYEEMEGLDQDDDSPDSKMESEWRKRRVSSKAQNWCDLFFILDILASRCLTWYWLANLSSAWRNLDGSAKSFHQHGHVPCACIPGQDWQPLAWLGTNRGELTVRSLLFWQIHRRCW